MGRVSHGMKQRSSENVELVEKHYKIHIRNVTQTDVMRMIIQRGIKT